MAVNPGRSVAELNRRYDALCDAARSRETLTDLTRHCGEGRVRYLQCDVEDPASVREKVRVVLEERGRIDVVLDVAGINRAADLASKRLADFRAVRDLKVRAYYNLKAALGASEPRLWVNFGSIVGFTGQSGETDYAAGNDFLASAAAYAVATGRPELTIAWCLWRDAGLGADPVKRAFLQRSGIYTGMSSAEGVHHFLREVGRPGHGATALLLGESETAALEDYRPGFLSAGASGTTDTTGSNDTNGTTDASRPADRDQPWTKGFYLDRVVRRDDRGRTYERTFDLRRDAYLAEHVVQGHPTLPGTFVTEIAAEAATDLVPGRLPVVFEDLRLSAFLRVYRHDRPARKTGGGRAPLARRPRECGPGARPRRRRGSLGAGARPGARALLDGRAAARLTPGRTAVGAVGRGR